VVGAWLLVGGLASTEATAQVPPGPPAPPVADPRQVAHEAYEAGKAAFEARDYLRAADLFLKAYHHAPHYDPLWNAARSLELAGERARAANLYSRYLDEAPPDARDRDRATAARRELAAALGRLDIQTAPGMTDVMVDFQPVDRTSLYVDPGDHIVHARWGQAGVDQVQTVAAGETASVVLAVPQPIGDARTGLPGQVLKRLPPAESERGARVLPPVVVIVGAGLAAVGAGFTIGSAVDTLSAKRQYESAPSNSLLQDGQSKQNLTNALFWTTVGVGVVTGVLAVAFVDWHPRRTRRSVGLGVGVGSLELRGAFP
jgi:tetratricopeptide (TPR) repeat protein